MTRHLHRSLPVLPWPCATTGHLLLLLTLGACAAGVDPAGAGDDDHAEGGDDLGLPAGGDGAPDPGGSSGADAGGTDGPGAEGDADGDDPGDEGEAGDEGGMDNGGDSAVGATVQRASFGHGAAGPDSGKFRLVRAALGGAALTSGATLVGADHDARVWIVDGPEPRLRLEIHDAFGDPLDAADVGIELVVYATPALDAAGELLRHAELVDVRAGVTELGDGLDWEALVPWDEGPWIAVNIDGDPLGGAVALGAALHAGEASSVRAAGLRPGPQGERIPTQALDASPVVVSQGVYTMRSTLPELAGHDCEHFMVPLGYPRVEAAEDVELLNCPAEGSPQSGLATTHRMGRLVDLMPVAASECATCDPRLLGVRLVHQVKTTCVGIKSERPPTRTLELVEIRNIDSSTTFDDAGARVMVTTVCQPR